MLQDFSHVRTLRSDLPSAACGRFCRRKIVEGSARLSEAEYVRFLEVAYGSARELQYEISLCARLGYLTGEAGDDLNRQCTETAKMIVRADQIVAPGPVRNAGWRQAVGFGP